jgi:glucose/arabinose dehydrogenase/PKD repeat protein
MRRRLLLAMTMTAIVAVPISNAHAITLPAGFSDEAVTAVASPTALAFTPDGRMLIATQPGALRVRTAAGSLVAAPAIDLAPKACTNSERGLLGIAVDPAFASNHFVYLYYTFNKLNSCATNDPSAPVNRVSRFVLSDTNVIDPASETVLVDNMPSPAGNHNAGDVQFGKDGNLYISIGDGGCDYAGGGCGGDNDGSRDENVLTGKLLRITPSGAIPADNPFQGLGSARCNLSGRTNPGMRCQETFAWGLRNPFRLAFDPNAAGTRFYINDVGQSTWEEIDEGTAGADYGWNVREGHCANGSTTSCAAPPAGMTNPVFDYGRGDGCGSITGGAFVPASVWPAAYGATYLFGDYVCGRIFQLVPNGSGGLDRLIFADGLGSSSAVDLQFGPNGTGRALYYTTYAGGGAVRRIVYSGSSNRAPTADVTASPASGAAPLNVSFNGSASRDPDTGDRLTTYVWDFGDGSPVTQTTSSRTTHRYVQGGTYTAQLVVRDNHANASAPDTVRIDAGNTPPKPTITSPTSGRRFAVGEVVQLRGTATDAQDGTLPASALSFTVLRHHDTHTHPYLGPVTGNTSQFNGPAPEDLGATTNSSIEVQLTATDSRGATATVTRTMSPKLVNLTFVTKPTGGLALTLNGTPFTTTRTWTSWQGWNVTVNAPDAPAHAFGSWSDGGARSHVIVTPTSARTYTATYRKVTP